MNAVFQKALDFATQAHAGQLYNREPYIKHCKRVAASVARLSANPDLPVAALLHDVVEDTPIALDDLHREFGVKVAEIVDHLTRREGETYMDYIARVRLSSEASIVKLADLQENIEQSFSPYAPLNAASLRLRYEKALRNILFGI